MIDYGLMKISRGAGSDGRVQTLTGSITIEEGSGRMVIRDSTTNKEIQVHDRTGSYYNDQDGRELISLTPNRGFLFNDGSNRRILLGKYATRVGLWISKPGKDVISSLGG